MTITIRHWVWASILACMATIVWLAIPNPSQAPNAPLIAVQGQVNIPKTTLNPILIPICTCESGLHHFEADGITVKRGRVNPNDVGICQINLTYHQAQAEKMGLDLLKEEDNIKYANWLYEQSGTTPWNWSKSCWQK